MGQLQDRVNSMLNVIGWSAARTGHPLAQMINDRRYEKIYKPLATEVARTTASMNKKGSELIEMENSGKRPDYESVSKKFGEVQRGIEESYDTLKNELKYPHSISREADIRDYLRDFDVSRDTLGDIIIRGQARQKYGGRRSASRTTERPMTDEEALENAYRTIARKEMATQNRRNMEEYIRFFHNPDMR